MTKLAWMFGAALVAGGFTAAAEAQQCESDDDCGRGTWCRGDGGKDVAVDLPACDGPDCRDPAPTPQVTLTCQPLPTGVCEVQGDCAEGLKCVIPTYTTGCDAPVPRDAGAAEPAPAPDPRASIDKQNCTPMEVTSRYGYCDLEPQPCKTDAECLEGLTCGDDETGGSSGSSGSADGSVGAQTEPARPPAPSGINKQSAGVCGFRVENCESTSDCAADWDCADVVVGGECSSSGGGSAGVACPSDGPCDEPIAEEQKPAEPECREIVEKQCIPSEIECAVDQNCPTRWRCVEFSPDGLPAPEPWKIEGSAQRCLPEGLVLYLQSQGAGRDAAGGFGEGAPTSDSANEDGAKAAPATGSGKSTCSLGLAGPSDKSSIVLLLGVLSWIGRRRRPA